MNRYRIKKHLIAFLTVLISISVNGASLGFTPIVKNWSAADYHGGRQNWSLSQDEDGLIYIGNNSTLLEFDNNIWDRYAMPKKDLVRSVYVSPDGRIYCGAYEEFGYFERSASGGLSYHSLSSSFADGQIRNEEIWNIISHKGCIFFQSFNSIFVYDGQQVQMIDGVHALNMFSVNGSLYLQVIDGDLLEMSFQGGAEFKAVVPKDAGIGQVVSVLPYGSGLLLLTASSGGFICAADGSLRPWKTELDSRLRRNTVNRAVRTRDGSYIIGTISDGIYSLDSLGRADWTLNMSSGLQNNTVLGLLCDDDDNIWAALDDGISYIDRTSGIYVYRPRQQTVGMVYDMLMDGTTTWMATNQGLYAAREGDSSLSPVLDGQIWFLEKVDGKVYCGHNQGIFLVSEGGVTQMTATGGGAFCMRRLQSRDATYIVTGTYALPCLYRVKENGNWEYMPVLREVRQMVKNMEYDGRGNIWCEHFKGGLVRLSLNPDFRELVEEVEYDSLGDVRDTVFNVMNVNGRVVFSNGRRFFTHEDLNDSIVPYDVLNRSLKGLACVHQAEPAGGTCYWFVSDRKAVLADIGRDSCKVLRTIPFSYFGVSAEERASVVYDGASGDSFLLLSNLIVRIDTDRQRADRRTDPARRLTLLDITASDRNGRTVQVELEDGVKVRNKDNSLTFTLRYPAYNNLDTRLLCRLEGLSDEWSFVDGSMTCSYQRLRAGKYRFVAEACNDDGPVARTSFSFAVRAPWYLAWWMICIYVLVIFLIVLTVHLISLKVLREENERRIEEEYKKLLEQREMQLEEELRSKSKDLAGMSMSLIAHNEVLESILKEKDLGRIRHIINGSLVSNKEQWDMFQLNFDRIHENFFRRLKEEYPDLTSTDLKLCAFLRLNLSTKDIANMLNLTVRGVESARYRLRKRLDIPAETSLVDFMINFR